MFVVAARGLRPLLKWWRVRCVLVLVAAGPLWWSSAALAETASLRVGTFNAQFLPADAFRIHDGTPNPYRWSARRRAQKLARRILTSGYDVIALQEVFDPVTGDALRPPVPPRPGPREWLVRRLKSRYPHYVARLGCSGLFCDISDSGLMLFSRYPFVSLPESTHRAAAARARSDGGIWNDVAFLEYREQSGEDRWAAKGAGYVRIRHPASGRFYSIVFTHLQSRGDAIRASQMADIRRLLKDTLGPLLIERETILFLGDLNIRAGRDSKEWRTHFGEGGFFTDTLKDAWWTRTVRADHGFTSSVREGALDKRIDYIGMSDPQNEVCVQHMTVAYNLRSDAPYVERGMGRAGSSDLSDHLGLNADLNRPAPHCAPVGRAPYGPQTVEATPTATIDGELRRPGGMQWYRLRAGTYSIGLSVSVDGRRIDCMATAVPPDRRCPRLHAYGPSDLSTPISPWKGEVSRVVQGGVKFVVDEGSLLLRVFHPERDWVGRYRLKVHRHRCTSRLEACQLLPDRPLRVIVPREPALYAGWYQVDVEATTNPARIAETEQSLRFFVDGLSSPDSSTTAFAEDGRALFSGFPVADEADPGSFRIEHGERQYGPQRLFLVVNTTGPGDYRVGWQTDHAILHGDQSRVPGAARFHIRVDETSDEDFIFDNKDEFRRIRVFADGAVIHDDAVDWNVDDVAVISLEHLAPIAFASSVSIQVREDDDWPAFPWEDHWFDIYSERTVGGPGAALRPWPSFGLTVKGRALVETDADYTLTYNLSRTLADTRR